MIIQVAHEEWQNLLNSQILFEMSSVYPRGQVNSHVVEEGCKKADPVHAKH